MRFVVKEFSELSLGELYKILQARSQIFILEKSMHCQDVDGMDPMARHFFLEDKGSILAYLRAFYTDDSKMTVKIGRVLSITHGIGLGAALMQKAIADIKENMKCKSIIVDSQKSAVGFYEKFGFKAISGEFLEEGVIHIKMQMEF